MNDFSLDRPITKAKSEEQEPDTRKILIAVNSCWKDLDSNEAIRQTWAKYVPEHWDLRFFLGNRNFTDEEQAKLFTPEWIGSPGTLGNLAPTTAKKSVIGNAKDLQADEILIDAPDSYLGLPWKTIESLKWALDRNYDGTIRAFVDTYLFPDRILKHFNFSKSDAAGWSFGCGPCKAHPRSTHSCPLGGAAYWLSPMAAEVVVASPVTHWGEDTMVGFALSQAGIPLAHDFRYVYQGDTPPEINRSKFSIHLNDRGTAWNPSLMRSTHFEQELGRKKWPNWDGTCKKDQSTRVLLHPRGPRCKMCGAFV